MFFWKNKENEDNEFEREAKLWGLSEEDKRIAKQERMSPADFIAADIEMTTNYIHMYGKLKYFNKGL